VACADSYDCYVFGSTIDGFYDGLTVTTDSGFSQVQGAPVGPDGNGPGSSSVAKCGCGASPTQTYPVSGGGRPPLADPVNPRDGDFYETTTDLTEPGSGVPFEFTRTYDSKVAQAQAAASTPGSLGYGWSDNLGMSVSYDSTAGLATVTEESGDQLGFDNDSSDAVSVASVAIHNPKLSVVTA
jgi:hypothetical protein